MPDINKFKKLSEIGYEVHPCCMLCAHSDFSSVSANNPFGQCTKHTYQHAKHDGERGVSIVAMGVCGDILLIPLGPPLGAHSEFIKKGED